MNEISGKISLNAMPLDLDQIIDRQDLKPISYSAKLKLQPLHILSSGREGIKFAFH